MIEIFSIALIGSYSDRVLIKKNRSELYSLIFIGLVILGIVIGSTYWNYGHSGAVGALIGVLVSILTVNLIPRKKTGKRKMPKSQKQVQLKK